MMVGLLCSERHESDTRLCYEVPFLRNLPQPSHRSGSSIFDLWELRVDLTMLDLALNLDLRGQTCSVLGSV
eukprot:15434290-Alexandrium_andersonii.AAC.1